MIDDKITVLIPTSPIPSHPSLLVIEKCIASVREHLPVAEIVIMADGVREEQKHYAIPYKKYVQELVKKMLFSKDGNITVFPFPEFRHQAWMTKVVLDMVKTPLVLFMEHDTFFLEGLAIDWEGIARVMLHEIPGMQLNTVQFHCQWEPWIIPEHEYLMLDKVRNYIDGVPFVRTWQYSARPHVALTQFYRDAIPAFFSADCRTFIEDRLSEVILQYRAAVGDEGWNDWRLAYYAPEGSIRRTWTEDGRAGDPKFPLKF